MKGAAAALAVLVFLGAGAWWWWRPAPLGVYAKAAARVNAAAVADCDRSGAERRLRLAQALDRFQEPIRRLWERRAAGDFPKGKMESVGPVFLRVSGPPERAQGFSSQPWSWEEAHGILLRTQADREDPENRERWRDFDTSVRFLLEQDVRRVLGKKEFLPPAETVHRFRPRPGVVRSGPREITVSLRAGKFAGAEEILSRMLEREWSQAGWRLRVRFTDSPEAYELAPLFHGSRSFVNHARRVMVVANYAWTRTVAHELGHVLGFDDHYYNVWHGAHCYYTQESRLADIMSNSEQGGVGEAHWRLLERAYPWRAAPAGEFSYLFESVRSSTQRRKSSTE